MDWKAFLEFPIAIPIGVILGALVPAAGFIFAVYKYGKSSMAEQVSLSEKVASLEKQRSVSFSEDLQTCRQSLANRDTKIIEVERELIKTQADLTAIAKGSNSSTQQQLGLVDELKGRLAKFDELRAALTGNEEELWRLRGITPTGEQADALRRSRTKVLMVGNLKGGVGKTTLTANLAAYFALHLRKRVLVIDLDYQGSLTATLMTAAKNALGANILADALLNGEVNGTWLATVPRELTVVLPQTRLITCGQIFDRFENQTMMRWLIGEISDDVRMRLSKLILSPEVQNAYDIVLIDAPPRTSLGMINALFTAHAMLVPTVLDSLSVDAAARFLRRMNGFRGLAPALNSVCVVPSLIQETRLKPDEEEALAELRTSLGNWSGNSHITENRIRHFPTLAKIAGREVGYVSDARYVRPAFKALGDELVKKLEL